MNDFYRAFKSITQPEEWSVTQLVTACDLITCGVAARPEYVETGGVPFLSSLNVKQGKIVWKGYQQISREDHSELTKNNKPVKGDILYTRVGSFGEAAVVENDYDFSVFVSLTLIKPKLSVVDNYFLKHLLNSSEVKALANNTTTGLGVQNLNVSEVRRFELPFPPLLEQQKIAAILTSVDEVIEKTQAQIDKLKDLKTAMMQELLSPLEGCYTDADGNTIPFKDSLLGRIPEGWEAKLCSDVCLKITDGEHISPKYVNNGFPILSAKDIQVYGINFSGAKFVSKDAYEKMLKRCNPEYGDVLIVSRGATIGKTTLNISTKSFALMGSVILLKPKIDCCYGAYLSLFIAQPHIRLKLLQLSGSSAQQAIYLKDIKEMVVPLPSMTEQTEIAGATISIDYRIVAVEKKLLAMKNTKKALMQDLLTGKVRVKVD
jgi:type I restriction enzyme S subunit